MILEFDKPTASGIVCVEGAAGNIYLESVADLERYKRIFSRLQSIALDPEGSAAMVTRIAATYEDRKDRSNGTGPFALPAACRPEGTRKK